MSFDELKILITGDTSGIEATMKRAINVMQGGIGKMNEQEVDWTAIFSRAVSPAIVSSVASVFAFAIAQSVQFQQAMNTTGTAAGETSGQLAQMSQSALNMSTTLPASASDIATSLTQVSALFGTNTKATNDITNAIAELASSGFGSLTDITKSAMDVFRQFGVTTEAQAVQVLTDMMHAAEGAKESIPALTDQFSAFSSKLPLADRSVESFNGLLATFAAEVATIGASGASAMFDSLATSANSAAGPMEILGIGFGTIQNALKTGNIVGVIGEVSTKLEKMGPDAFLVAQGFGFSQQQVAAFQTNSQRLPQIAEETKTIATNTQSIAAAFNQSDSALRELLIDWNKFSALFTSGTLANVLEEVAKAIGLVLDSEKWMIDHAADVYNAVTDPFSELMKILPQIPNLIHGIFSAGGSVTSFLGDIGSNIESLLGIQSSPLNSALQKTGVGFSSDALSRIDKTASQNGLVDSLVSALQSGGKGNQYAQTIATFNLTLPQGSNGWSPKDLASALYAKFQGTQ